MKTLRIVIIDDEVNAVEGMLTILNKFCVDVDIVGTANSASSGIEIIKKTLPDLVFIDIEMPDASGFDVVNVIKNKKTLMVFVTAFEQYAVRAFKANVIDYLLKPVDIEDVQNIISKARELIKEREVLDHINSEKKQNTKLSIPTNKGILFLEADEILYIEADGRYSKIIMINDETVFVSKNLGEIEEMLDSYCFFRAHNSIIVNMKHVCRLNTKEGNYIVMAGGHNILLSRRRKEDFLKLFVK